jgi:hypothetical protein
MIFLSICAGFIILSLFALGVAFVDRMFGTGYFLSTIIFIALIAASYLTGHWAIEMLGGV